MRGYFYFAHDKYDENNNKMDGCIEYHIDLSRIEAIRDEGDVIRIYMMSGARFDVTQDEDIVALRVIIGAQGDVHATIRNK